MSARRRATGPTNDLRLFVHEPGGGLPRLYLWRAHTLRRRGRMAQPDYDPEVLAEVVVFPSRRAAADPRSAA